jgi:hypothetical protein
MPPLQETIFEKHLMAESNRHHIIFTRKSYTSKVERAYRSHKGLIVPLHPEGHKELHCNVEPPLKPSARQMVTALAMLDKLPDCVLNDPFETMQRLAGFYEGGTEREQRIGINILRQAVYVQEFAAC